MRGTGAVVLMGLVVHVLMFAKNVVSGWEPSGNRAVLPAWQMVRTKAIRKGE